MFWGMGKKGKGGGVYTVPFTIEECLEMIPAAVDEKGNVTRDNLFLPCPKKEWFPNRFVAEGVFDVMGTQEEVYITATNKTFQLCYAGNLAFLPPKEEDVLAPRQIGFVQLMDMPWFIPGFLRPLVGFLLHWGSANYNITHTAKNSFQREHCIGPFGVHVIDSYSVGPAHNGRADMSSYRFQAVFSVPPLLALVFYPVLSAVFQQAWPGFMQGSFEQFAACYTSLHPEIEEKDMDIPPPQLNFAPDKKATAVGVAGYLFALGAGYFKCTSWLSKWLLELAEGWEHNEKAQAWLTPTALRVGGLAGFCGYLFAVYLKHRSLGIKPRDWPVANNAYMKATGLDKANGKLKVVPVEWVNGKDASGRYKRGPVRPANPLPASCVRIARDYLEGRRQK